MKNLKETNSFYEKEDTDTRLKYSVAVPDDDKDAMDTFEPKSSFGFQENFKKTLAASKIKNINNNDVRIYKPKHTSNKTQNKSKILLEISESLRILDKYVQECEDFTKVYLPKNMFCKDDVKISESKIRIKK